MEKSCNKLIYNKKLPIQSASKSEFNNKRVRRYNYWVKISTAWRFCPGGLAGKRKAQLEVALYGLGWTSHLERICVFRLYTVFIKKRYRVSFAPGRRGRIRVFSFHHRLSSRRHGWPAGTNRLRRSYWSYYHGVWHKINIEGSTILSWKGICSLHLSYH